MRLPFLLVALVMGCGVVEQQAASQQRDPLVGGNVDDGGFRDVVMLRAVFTNDAGVTQGFACTGTIITPTVVLTAAHCLNENGGPSGYALTGVFFHNFDVAPPTNSASWVPATSWRRHPSWSAGSAMNTDIGLVRLPAPIPGVTPSPYLNRPLVAADVGQPMKVVGYGITSSGGTGAGTRRFVTLPLRGLTTQHVQLGNMSTAGICNGDSGGPSFLTARDGCAASLVCTRGPNRQATAWTGSTPASISTARSFDSSSPTTAERPVSKMGSARVAVRHQIPTVSVAPMERATRNARIC